MMQFSFLFDCLDIFNEIILFLLWHLILIMPLCGWTAGFVGVVGVCVGAREGEAR